MHIHAPTHPGQAIADRGLPGVYVRHGVSEAGAAGERSHGLPVFVGLARAKPGARRLPAGGVVKLGRSDAQVFDSHFECPAGGRLRASLAGYFVNGGEQCFVMPVDPAGDADIDAGHMAEVFEPGGLLEDVGEANLICLPDAYAADAGDPAGGRGLHRPAVARAARVHAAALAHCRRMGERFALLDGPPPSTPDSADDAVAEAVALAASLRSPWGAMYFPWVRATPQWTRPAFAAAFAGSAQWRCPGAAPASGEAHVLTLPASGLVSGQFAARDRTVGPQRAPGGALLIAAVDPVLTMTTRQCAALNSAGVNPLRFDRAAAGVVVSGARTLQAVGELAYVSTVRVVAEFRRWLAFGLSDLVFEPNSPALRERVRVRLVARCERMLQDGALAAQSAQQAYFVQCDDEVNPPGEADSGRVVAIVGLAPSVPAEFIEVRVIHDAGGTISTEFA